MLFFMFFFLAAIKKRSWEGPGTEFTDLGRFEGFRKGILLGKLGPVNLRKFGPPGSTWRWAWEEKKQ